MARRKNDQLNSSNLVVNQQSSSNGMKGLSQAPHPDSGRPKGLSPKTLSKEKMGKFPSKTGAQTQMGPLPFGLQ